MRAGRRGKAAGVKVGRAREELSGRAAICRVTKVGIFVYVSSMRRRRDVMVYVRVVALGWSVDSVQVYMVRDIIFLKDLQDLIF